MSFNIVNNPQLTFKLMKLDYFSSYCEHLENYLKDKINYIEKSFDNCAETLNILDKKESTELYEMHFEDIHYQFKEEYPIILRTSLFLSIYAFLEKTLNDICLSYENSHKDKLNDIPHNGIHKSKVYLTNVCNIDFPTKNWGQIRQYNIIRNFLAHEGYALWIPKEKLRTPNKNEQRLKDLINTISGTSLINEGSFYLVNFEKEFCEEFLSVLYKFFDDLDNVIEL